MNDWQATVIIQAMNQVTGSSSGGAKRRQGAANLSGRAKLHKVSIPSPSMLISTRPGRILQGLLCLLLVACSTDETPAVDIAEKAPQYVGSDTCATCHAEQFASWHSSQHFLAMQPVTAESVLGDFSDRTFGYAGIDYRFTTRDGRYYVLADDSDGAMREFEISHVFGVDPLQQYLVAFPDGRLQALSVAWDTRPTAAGGQRWFHVYPDEAITAGDELHWTGRNQNWNYMCADCHSTDLRKNYDAGQRSYATRWSEMSVGCEACHGPGSGHIVAANGKAYSSPGLTTMLASQQQELDTCAHCHSRRGVMAEGFTPGDQFLDHYRLSLLDEGLYFADGQIQDEVYVYGSFLQSRMYASGVRCSDCHDPHSAALQAAGNETCTRCHQGSPPDRFPTLAKGSYDSPAHHFHEPGSAGAECVNCHMAARTYMVVDPRRDHSFRIPRPDLTVSLGVPNACNGCHDDRPASWAAAEIERRFPVSRPEHYAEAIAAGRSGDADAATRLAALASDAARPAIVRATALSLLGGAHAAASMDTIAAAAADAEPLLRYGALLALQGLDIERAWPIGRQLLTDPLRTVRIEAATVLSPALNIDIRQADRERLTAAMDESIAALRLNADRPEALTMLAGMLAEIGREPEAEQAFRDALLLDPRWLPALVNFADFHRSRGRNDESASLLQTAVEVAPENGDVRYAYGMALVRQGRSDAALAEFERATRLSPGTARYTYVYGVALNSAGQPDAAVTVLEQGHRAFPQDVDILLALATIERDRGHPERALQFARRLAVLQPANRELQQLVQQLETRVQE